MSWFEIALRSAIVIFGIWAVINSVLIGIELWRKTQDED